MVDIMFIEIILFKKQVSGLNFRVETVSEVFTSVYSTNESDPV